MSHRAVLRTARLIRRLPVAALPLVAEFAASSPVRGQDLYPTGLTSTVPGYEHAVRGEVLTYHSPVPAVDRSLLVRSLARSDDIAWTSAPVPDWVTADTVEFVLLIGIDVNDEPRRFDLFVGGDSVLTFTHPLSAEHGPIHWTGRNGVDATFAVTEIDKYGDAMGYLFVCLLHGYWAPGSTVDFRVAGESAGERTWFMAFMEPIACRIRVRHAPALLRTDSGALQTVRVEVLHLGLPERFTLTSRVTALDTAVVFGFDRFELAVPRVDTVRSVALDYRLGRTGGRVTAELAPVRPLVPHLIHHTHLDSATRITRTRWSSCSGHIWIVRRRTPARASTAIRPSDSCGIRKGSGRWSPISTDVRAPIGSACWTASDAAQSRWTECSPIC